MYQHLMYHLVLQMMVGIINWIQQKVIYLNLIGFFSKENYGFIQFTAGLDKLEPDATAVFITVALIISLALPATVAIIALIVTLRRRFSKQSSNSYNAIRD